MMWLAIVLALAGFAALCLAMSRHQRDVLGTALTPLATRCAKAGGWCAIALSYAVAVMAEGAAFGSVYWVGLLTFAALCVALVVSRLGHATRRSS